MQIPGHVPNGVVVLDGEATLAEGSRILVFQLSSVDQSARTEKEPVDLPLVSRGEPGSIHLTNERIDEILDDEDLETMKQYTDLRKTILS